MALFEVQSMKVRHKSTQHNMVERLTDESCTSGSRRQRFLAPFDDYFCTWNS